MNKVAFSHLIRLMGPCWCVLRLHDAVSLVSLFNMVHPNSECAQEAQSQQASGPDLLKVSTAVSREYSTLSWG